MVAQPTVWQFQRKISSLKKFEKDQSDERNEALGMDLITAEILKEGAGEVAQWLLRTCNKIMDTKKVVVLLLLNRLKSAVDNRMREEQAGYRPGRSCADQIIAPRRIV
eukprot:gene17152-8688_t